MRKLIALPETPPTERHRRYRGILTIDNLCLAHTCQVVSIDRVGWDTEKGGKVPYRNFPDTGVLLLEKRKA